MSFYVIFLIRLLLNLIRSIKHCLIQLHFIYFYFWQFFLCLLFDCCRHCSLWINHIHLSPIIYIKWSSNLNMLKLMLLLLLRLKLL